MITSYTVAGCFHAGFRYHIRIVACDRGAFLGHTGNHMRHCVGSCASVTWKHGSANHVVNRLTHVQINFQEIQAYTRPFPVEAKQPIAHKVVCINMQLEAMKNCGSAQSAFQAQPLQSLHEVSADWTSSRASLFTRPTKPNQCVLGTWKMTLNLSTTAVASQDPLQNLLNLCARSTLHAMLSPRTNNNNILYPETQTALTSKSSHQIDPSTLQILPGQRYDRNNSARVRTKTSCIRQKPHCAGMTNVTLMCNLRINDQTQNALQHSTHAHTTRF